MSFLFYISKRFLTDKKYIASYTILKVKNKSTPQDIRNNFLKLTKIYHPDNVETGNHSRFLRLKAAYDLIKDAPLLNEGIKSENTFESEIDCDLSHKAHVQYRAQTGTQIVNEETDGIYRNLYNSKIIRKFKYSLFPFNWLKKVDRNKQTKETDNF